MEDVLDVYQWPYDANHSVIGMDEQPVPLIKETRQPISATITNPRRVIMSTNVRERQVFFCLQNLCQDGVML